MALDVTTPPRDTTAKIRLFRSLFTGLTDVYGTYDPDSGRSWQVKAPVTDSVVYHHLKGFRPFGVYLLTGAHTRAAVADFDREDANAPKSFIDAAAHYGMTSYLERSKSKGFHAWVFFEQNGVLASKARAVLRRILDEIECGSVEVFPKRDRIAGNERQWGNFVNAPLFGKRVSEGKTVFVDPSNALLPYPDQWDVLEQVRVTPEALLDEIMEVNGIAIAGMETVVPRDKNIGTWQRASGLPPCAQRMLAEGVTEYQRLSCFRLAVHLRRLGLPFDVAVAALEAWSARNRPAPGKRVISFREIKAQAAFAYQKEYGGNGCDQPEVVPFCAASCHLYPVIEAQRRRSSRP